MTGTEPIGSLDYTALMLATEACAVGDCLVYDSTLGYYRVASAAHRASASSMTEAIARSAYGGSEVSKVKYQTAGILSQAVTGLAILTPTTDRKLVRVSTAGRLERVDSYTAGDDIVGYAYWNGRVALHIGLPWQLIASYAGGTAALPAGSIQASNPDATFLAASHAKISDDGYIEARSKTAGAQPTFGTIRGDDGGLDDADGWSVAIKMADGGTVQPLMVYSASGASAPWDGPSWRWSQDGGYSDPTLHASIAYRHYWWQAGVRGPVTNTDPDKFSYVTLIYVPGTSPSPGITGRRFFSLSSYTNFLMIGDNADPANWEDALATGEGVISLGKPKVEPSTSPAAGFTVLWPSRSNLHLKQRIGATVYDLTAPAAGVAGKIQTTDGSGTLTASGAYAGADYISLIAGTPDVPGVRLANNTTLSFGNASLGGADIVACYVDSANQVRVGSAFDATQTGILFATPSGGGHRFTFNFDTLTYAYLNESEFAIDVPRHGYTSPYASEGQASFAVTAGSHTLTPTEYTRRIIKFTGTFGGTSTITLPAPSDADHSYVKAVRNTSTTALTLTKGSGTTAAVAAGTDKQVLITPDGVFVT